MAYSTGSSCPDVPMCVGIPAATPTAMRQVTMLETGQHVKQVSQIRPQTARNLRKRGPEKVSHRSETGEFVTEMAAWRRCNDGRQLSRDCTTSPCTSVSR